LSEGEEDFSDSRYQDAGRNITQLAKFRTERRWPEKIVANLTADTLDNFIYQNVVASRLVMGLVEQGVGLLVIRDFDEESRIARDAITSVNLPFHSELRIANPPEGLFPLDWFDEGHGAPVMSDHPEWEDGRWVAAELLLMPQMLDFDAVTAQDFGALGPLFWLPKTMWERAKTVLTGLGFDDDTWYGVVDVEALGLAQAAIEAIIEQGGRALVFSEIPAVTNNENVVCLPSKLETFETRMAAIAMASVVIGRDHYHTTLASAFTTPCALVEGTAYERRLWNAGDIYAQAGGEGPKVTGITRRLLDNGPKKTLAKSPEIKVHRGTLEAIPLRWPQAEPVIQFWD